MADLITLDEMASDEAIDQQNPERGTAAASRPFASDRVSAEEMHNGELETGEITWSELGCPTESGVYPLDGHSIRVRRIHVIVAEDDPDARFTLLVQHPPHGPTEYLLGHRVA